MLKVCPTCNGADTDLRPCSTCKGVRMVPDSPAGDADDEPAPPAAPGERVVSEARIALREAALNYAASRLMSAATAEHINKAFEDLEQAANDLIAAKRIAWG